MKIQLRRDISTRWTQLNPILADGEPGVERDTGRMKVGDGHTRWTELDYLVPSSFLIDDHIADETPHPVYDDGPSLNLLYQNAKV